MERKRWTREELVRALALYCQLPFGKMHSRNPAIKALATAIGRTPSSVSLKLVNFASLDPEVRGRGVAGMGNTSSADREVWGEFYGKWEELAERAADGPAVVAVPAEELKLPTGPSEVRREVAVRRGQAFFRAAVLAAHESTCCITGVTCEALLRASHIVPWSKDEKLRLDPHNGLCLNALHDAAFDRGLITFSEKFELKISKRLKNEVPQPVYSEMFESRAGVAIKVPDRFRPTAMMLEFHRSKVFVA